tara:strand:+ start:537 stop:1166 length:630 start_codon:yes stop_codon:yes gene_type:complete
MFIKLLNDDDLAYCLKYLNNIKFNKGTETQPIENIKSNLESSNLPNKVRALITQKLYDTHYIDSIYCPKHVSVNYCNEYTKDDYYNIHVDSFKAVPKENNVYFDYGFTINLNDDYEGGEFILQTEIGNIARQLKKGEACIFPIIYPHGVNKILNGTRRNIIGWISSNISYEQAFILRNLYEVNNSLKDNNDMYIKSTLVQNYLKKEWSK